MINMYEKGKPDFATKTVPNQCSTQINETQSEECVTFFAFVLISAENMDKKQTTYSTGVITSS